MTACPPMFTPLDLPLPDLPEELAGFKIAHISDLHVKRHRRRHGRIAAAMEAMPVDLAVLTGDYMDRPGHEKVTLQVLEEVVSHIQSRHGIVGVFGNHDTPKFRELCSHLPVHWLVDDVFQPAGLPLTVYGVAPGLAWEGDSLALLANSEAKANQVGAASSGVAAVAGSTRTLRLLASHYPGYIPVASDLGMDLVLSGHTHGGQMRLPGRRALVNSSDLPIHLTAGILRHRQTLCVVSRGLGESILPFRLFCPPHIPLYTLRCGPLRGQVSHHVENVHPW